MMKDPVMIGVFRCTHVITVVRGEAGCKMLHGVHCQSDRDKVGEYLLCRPGGKLHEGGQVEDGVEYEEEGVPQAHHGVERKETDLEVVGNQEDDLFTLRRLDQDPLARLTDGQ